MQKKDIDTDNPCHMCGYNYYNNSGIINNTYINCYINDTSEQVPIDISINNIDENLINTTSINEYTNSILIEESDEYTTLINQLSTSYYSSFDSSIIIEKEIEIKNKSELIQNIINNLFNKLNISNIDNGEDEISAINNTSIIISTKNQKKKENEKIKQ